MISDVKFRGAKVCLLLTSLIHVLSLSPTIILAKVYQTRLFECFRPIVSAICLNGLIITFLYVGCSESFETVSVTQ